MRPAVKVEQKASSNDEKVKLLKEISQLQQKIKALERERNNTVFSKKSEMRPFYSDLEESNIKIEEERKNEALKMRRDLDKLKSNVSAFRNTVLELKPGAGRLHCGETIVVKLFRTETWSRYVRVSLSARKM